MIHASIYGRLAFDPTERTTKAGKPMATARLAVEAGSNADTQETLWIDLLAFGQQADALLALTKGQMCSAIGRLTKGRYTVQSTGEEREQLTLIADSLISAKSARPKTKGQSESGAAPRREPAGYDDAISF